MSQPLVEKKLCYKGFTIFYKQTDRPDPSWSVIVYYIGGAVRSPLCFDWVSTEESAIDFGKGIIDREIEFWRAMDGKIAAPCPYPSSVLEEKES